ncbi:actin-like ATPase domain-containing protein [Delitschia confertaspora ATCC 74209]|uniref:Actin-like ATPase domain-containing protein n=1 Tax=Delitschia confertaspora ATCC 74209 TaxID=1513339 RepID=A0A9P4JLS9_9PLEO|nr:actin-like ATPase domain-containing protein [Delitschia confertaspora ATCC 74209]
MPRRIIVSLDFGTTFSGLAWAETNRADYQYVIEDWPASTSSARTKSSAKVPTELRSINNGFQWGFQIPATAKRNKYFKLKLDEPTGSTTDSKPPEELTQLYLSFLYKHLISVLEQRLSASVVNDTPIDFVLTVPAIWSNSAKQKTEKAAVRAGFKGSKKIHLVSEPEAAAIYTLHNLGTSSLQVGKTFVVCDAGGGTVDLISYKITRLSPKLEVEEATEGTGEKCGSSLLNQRFRRHLKQKRGGEYWTDDRLVEAMNTFETFKKGFTPRGEPLSVRVDLPDDTSLGIRRGRLKISQTEMATEIFEPIIIDVLGLVREQIRMAGGTTVAAVLLVGGFGQSNYLKERIRSDVGITPVLQPENGWTAVVQGAAMIGLARANANLARVYVSSRTARKHYGTELTVSYDSATDDSNKKFWYKKWNEYAVNRMFWFVTKGESYPENRPSVIDWSFDIPVNRGVQTGSSVTVYVNDRDSNAPRYRNDNTRRVAKLELDLDRFTFTKKLFSRKKMMGGHWYNCFKCSIKATYESAWITYTLMLKGKCVLFLNNAAVFPPPFCLFFFTGPKSVRVFELLKGPL